MIPTDSTMKGKIKGWRRGLFLLLWLTRPIRALWLCFFPLKFDLDQIHDRKYSYGFWFRFLRDVDYLHCDPVFKRGLEMLLSRADRGPGFVMSETVSEAAESQPGGRVGRGDDEA